MSAYSLYNMIERRVSAPRFRKNLRWPILGMALLICALLPMVASLMQLALLLGLLIAVGGALLLLKVPPLGVVALIFVALIAPSPSLPGGLNVAVIYLAALVGLWVMDMVVRRQVVLVPSATVRPLLAFVGVSILAFVVGQLPWFGFRGGEHAPLDTQIGGLAIFVLAAGAFLLVAHVVTDLRWLQWFTYSYIAVASLATFGWLTPWLVRGWNNRLLQPGTTSNSMFWLWLVALSCSQALYNRKLHLVWRLVLGGICLGTMYVTFVMISDWKSGYLPAFVAIGVIVAARSWRFALALGVMGMIPAQILFSQAIATDEYSYLSRLDAWMVVLKMLKFNPILGFGPANYYNYTILFVIRGYHSYFNSHNQYLDIIAQVGLVGMACFFWFAWEVGKLGWRLRTLAPEGFARAYVYGALGGLAGMLASGMLVDWFLPFVYNIGLPGFRSSMLAWAFLGGLVSIEQIVRRENSEPPTA